MLVALAPGRLALSTGGYKGALMIDMGEEPGRCWSSSSAGAGSSASSTTCTLFCALVGVVLGHSDDSDGVAKAGSVL